MELRHLRYFVAVAEELHFGRAAERLFVAQSAVSQQIAMLERELGVTLLARNRRHVHLTDAGESFLIEARRTLRQSELAATAAIDAAAGRRGRLRVGFFGPATYNLVPKILTAYRQRYPDVVLDPVELTSSDLLHALGRERVDVGFMRGPVAPGPYTVELSIHEPVLLALPRQHPLASRRRIALPLLLNDQFVIAPRSKEPVGHDHYMAMCRDAGFSPRVVVEAEHIHTLIGLVAAGLGVGLVPESVTNLKRAGVVFRSLQPPSRTIETAIVRRPDATSAVIDQLIAVARELAAP